jgi:hypothetical protein
MVAEIENGKFFLAIVNVDVRKIPSSSSSFK